MPETPLRDEPDAVRPPSAEPLLRHRRLRRGGPRSALARLQRDFAAREIRDLSDGVVAESSGRLRRERADRPPSSSRTGSMARECVGATSVSVNANRIVTRDPPIGDRSDVFMPGGRGPGELRDRQTPSADTNFTVFHLNARGLNDRKQRNLALVDALLGSLGHPTFVVITETWLNDELEIVNLSGYHRVSRLDRRGAVRGGVAVFARKGYESSIVHVGDSEVDERSWHIIHANSGPILLGAWYRPPDDEVDSIHRFEREYLKFSEECVSSIVVGDMNTHNKDWLRWSNSNSREGRVLEDICCGCGLEQKVHGPTRGPYLLDLVLSDFLPGIKAKVTAGIHDNDHRGVPSQ